MLLPQFWKMNLAHYGVLATQYAQMYVKYNRKEGSKKGGVLDERGQHFRIKASQK